MLSAGFIRVQSVLIRGYNYPGSFDGQDPDF